MCMEDFIEGINGMAAPARPFYIEFTFQMIYRDGGTIVRSEAMRTVYLKQQENRYLGLGGLMLSHTDLTQDHIQKPHNQFYTYLCCLAQFKFAA